ncbi:hypothetical protein ACH4SK_30100 [Streptomyces inhibens]|uniref:hypothetical protein n=1 Tax=Streptomyces inhibens TaxID=2293571 RepID=UPI00379BDDD6
MRDQLHRRADCPAALPGVGDPPDVQITDIAVEALDAADALVLGPQQRQEGRPARVVVLRLGGLGLVLPQQPEVLVRAGFLQMRGHRLTERGAAQRVVLAGRQPAPDRPVGLGGSLREDVVRHDAAEGAVDDLCGGGHCCWSSIPVGVVTG